MAELMFTVTPRVLETLGTVLQFDGLSTIDRTGALAKLGEPESISLEDLKLLHECAQKASSEQIWLHEMMQGCGIVNPKPAEAEKDPAQEAARARRKAEYEEIQYQKMVRELGIRTHKAEADETLKSLTSGISIGLSVVVSMMTMFTVCYYMASNANFSPVVVKSHTRCTLFKRKG